MVLVVGWCCGGVDVVVVWWGDGGVEVLLVVLLVW